MAQWYTQLLFKGDEFLGDSLADWQGIEEVLPTEGTGIESQPPAQQTFTAIIVSGYALYGQLHGYYALGVAHIAVDSATGRAYYCSEQSALHREPVETLTPAQKAAVQAWLKEQYPSAWENSVDAFKRSLVETG